MLNRILLNKVAGCKISIQKSLDFIIYKAKDCKTNLENNPINFDLKEYSGDSLSKEMKDLYKENFRTGKEEVAVDIRRRKDLPSSRVSRISTVAALPEAIPI